MKLIKYEYPRLPSVFDLNRWFEDMWSGLPRWPGVEDYFESEFRTLQPAADLYEDKNNYYARMEFPGFKKDELKVDMESEVLTVNAEHKEGENTTTFSRSLSVPKGTDSEQVEAKYEDGILTVTLPKVEQSKPKSIHVN